WQRRAARRRSRPARRRSSSVKPGCRSGSSRSLPPVLVSSKVARPPLLPSSPVATPLARRQPASQRNFSQLGLPPSPYALGRANSGRRLVPNEVYEAAVEGLSSLVSPRVAKRIIDDSLRATSRTADDVSSTAMRRLLLGRVRSELEGVMPAAAVGPGLVQLAEELQGSRSRGRGPWWRRAGRGRRSRTSDAERD